MTLPENSFGWNDVQFPRQTFPTMPLLGLSDSEQALIHTLQAQARNYRFHLELAEAYYLGAQIVKNLRIAVPRELEFLRTIVGWARMAVDPYVERLHADGFRIAGETDVDGPLGEVMDANQFCTEQALSFTDALSMGRSYWLVGSPAETGESPMVTVESPLNMAVLWDLSGKNAAAAMQEYWDGGRRHATLVVPGQTVTLAQDDKGLWVVVNRDQHGFDFVPVVRMPNRARTHERDGRSEITPALRSYIDAACRTLLGLEVAREIYSVPQKTILGATEADFVKPDGSLKSAWETYIHLTLALERDDEGNLPQIHQASVYDPSAFTRLLDWYASAAAGEVAATPQDLGLYTQGNPASAEAVQAYESRRDRRAVNMQQQFEGALTRVAQYAMRFQNGGTLPDKYRRLAVDWSPVTQPIPGITSDAVSKEIASGAIPPTSDVTLKRLGYSAVERARLAQDRDEDQGQSFLNEIASSLTAKDAKVDKSLLGAAGAPVPTADEVQGKAPVPTPAQVFGGKNRAR